MCEHQSFHTNARKDPTRTLGIRRRFEAEMYRRFRRLKGLIREALVDDDGLSTNAVAEGRFDFPTSAGKVEAFMGWLREQELSGEIAIKRRPGRVTGQREWADIYVDSAYQQGIRRARAELRKRGVEVPDDTDRSFNQPFHADRVGMIYSRVYSELDGITEAMDQQISRTLAQGITEGRNPLEIARQINDRVDKIGITRARMLARTEVIRAHHSANIQEYKQAGIDGVDVQAEWVTAAGACPECLRLSRQGPYEIDEIEGMIPAHPNCFEVGTRIDSKRGWIPVEDLVIGDMVRSIDPDTLEISWKPVIATVSGYSQEVLRIAGLTVTSDHDMLVYRDEMLYRKKAADIEPDDLMVNSQGEYVECGPGAINFSMQHPTEVACVQVADNGTLHALSDDGTGIWCGNCRCVAVPRVE